MSIDWKKNKVSNLNQEKNILACNTRQSVALFVFCFFKIIVCKDDDVSALTAIIFINENIEKCTMMNRAAMRNGIENFLQSNCSHFVVVGKNRLWD